MAKHKWNSKMPAPDDLKGWKEADRWLSERFAEHLQFEDRLWSSRAAKRYFDDDNLEYFFKEHHERAVVQAYIAWGILDYRPNRTSKTHAEKMLEEGLPEPEATLLRARMEAYPTLYRVAGHNPRAGTIDLEDVLLGGMVTVHDLLMSENIKNNLFLCGRAFSAGRFHFIELAGPPLGAGMGTDAVEFLRDCGMEFTHEGLRRDAHKFGWLWGWIDRWQANWRPPRLCNTDGEDLLWHTASFSVANPADVRQALLQRQDIEYDDQEDEFVWVKETGQGAKMLGGPVTMGRIEFVGDELVLTVNSAKRFATARKWLEKRPGVVFLKVETRRVDEIEKDRPMDERISKSEPVEITPELAASLQEMIDRQYMEWIDTPLPVLGGKTPRQACRTPAGRQQVTMLIRTMPDPMGQAPVRVPRQAMLRELGLTTESLTSRPLSPQMSQISKPVEATSPSKVGRNAPCPCGSGKKYKKCCWHKKFEWVQDDDGTIRKAIPIPDELKELLEEQREAFIAEHGREPGPDDLLFPDLPHPEHLEHMMVEDMKKTGIDPALIHAFEETGMLVSDGNEDLFTDHDMDEWYEAIAEYEMKHGAHEPTQFPIGTIALYGPDDKTTTKIVAGVIVAENAEPILERWVGTKLKGDQKVLREIKAFFKKHKVKSAVMTDGNLGCPHEEGEDFPVGEDCPFCPFWKGKQGSAGNEAELF